MGRWEPAFDHENATAISTDAQNPLGTPPWGTNPPPNWSTPFQAVLMAPGSVTHHSDMHQRYVELALDGETGGSSLTFRTPLDSRQAPRGYYMLFVLTNHGVPSVATWVKLEQP